MDNIAQLVSAQPTTRKPLNTRDPEDRPFAPGGRLEHWNAWAAFSLDDAGEVVEYEPEPEPSGWASWPERRKERWAATAAPSEYERHEDWLDRGTPIVYELASDGSEVAVRITEHVSNGRVAARPFVEVAVVNKERLAAMAHADLAFASRPERARLARRVAGTVSVDDLTPEPEALRREVRAAVERALGLVAKHFCTLQEWEASLSSDTFPVDVLPEDARVYALQVASGIGVPVSMTGAPILLAALTAIGDRADIQIKPGWREPAAGWLAIVAPTGSGKTPALDGALAPLETIQEQADAEFERLQRLYEAAKKRGDEAEPPEREHIILTDTTVEALAMALGNGVTRGLLLVKDELTGFAGGFDAYRGGKGGDRDLYLSLHSGKRHASLRVSRGFTVTNRPRVSIIGGIQPARLAQIASEADQESGFAPRFLWVDAGDLPALRPSDAAVDPWAEAALTTRLVHIRQAVNGTVRLSPEARRTFDLFSEANADAIDDGLVGLERGWAAKAPAHVARLALALHALEHGRAFTTTEVTPETMERAISLGEYFAVQAARIAAAVALAPGSTARILLDAVREADSLTRADLHELFGRNLPRHEMDAGAAVLERLGYIRRERVQGAKGRPAEVWRRIGRGE